LAGCTTRTRKASRVRSEALVRAEKPAFNTVLFMVLYRHLIKYRKECLEMNAIAAQDIKKRGISAVDEALKEGPVHVIKNNQPRYVVLSEERYRDLLAAEDEAYIARVRASLEDVKAGRVRRFKSAGELLKAIEAEDDK
jgi:PHD/YefM family antitoxin component YafN of YafNO toxin-antitoxin module